MFRTPGDQLTDSYSLRYGKIEILEDKTEGKSKNVTVVVGFRLT